jgi:hypothetical protein
MSTNNPAALLVQTYVSWVALGGKEHYEKALSVALPLLASRLNSLKISTSRSEVNAELKSVLKTNLQASLESRSSSAFDCFCKASYIPSMDSNGMLGDLIQVTSNMSADPELNNEVSALIQRTSDLLIGRVDSEPDSTPTSEPAEHDIPCKLTFGFRGKVTVRFECPACSHGMKAGETDIGQTYPCPTCQMALVIPGAQELNEHRSAQEELEAKKASEAAERPEKKAPGSNKERVVTDSDWDNL